MFRPKQKFKAYTTSIVNRVQHVVTVASSEVENSEDPNFRMPVQAAAAKLRESKSAVLLFLNLFSSPQAQTAHPAQPPHLSWAGCGE